MGALFSKPYEKLREAFLLGRLEESGLNFPADPYGSIDRFGSTEGEAEVPCAAWEKRLLGISNVLVVDSPFELLNCGATRLDELMAGKFVFGPDEPFSSLYEVLALNLYLGVHNRILIETGKGRMIAMSDVPRSEAPKGLEARSYALDDEEAVGAAVRDVLFAEWKYRRPKWEMAKTIIVDALCEELRRRCKDAENAFDTAVAVSEDGKKIVHADWVVIRSGRWPQKHTSVVYPASVFSASRNKILRVAECTFQRGYFEAWRVLPDNVPVETISPAQVGLVSQGAIKALTHSLMGEHPDMMYAACALPGGNLRILICDKRFCPNPLPKGGIVIKR